MEEEIVTKDDTKIETAPESPVKEELMLLWKKQL